MTLDLSRYFEHFIQDITIGPPQTDRMDSAVTAITEFLQTGCNLPAANFFTQGSVPNGTAVEPVDGGEYDVDLVAYCVPAGVTAEAALDTLEALFAADGRYRPRLVKKQPCVRLEYAEDEIGEFHVDVVPVRRGQGDGPYDAPRRGAGWHATAPVEYTQWCRDQGDDFSRTVRAFKRWRDEQQPVRSAIKSIVLQVLVAQYMPRTADDAARFAGTISALQAALGALSTAPAVLNPVLPSENLAARWTPASFRSFVQELTEAEEWTRQAQETNDVVEAAAAWREVLGASFPNPDPAALGLKVADASHEQAVAAKGWRMELDPRYSVTITASTQLGKRGQKRTAYKSGSSPIFAGHKVRFLAQTVTPERAEVWWQVTNTGGHARQRSSLRGGFLQARSITNGASHDPKEHWESTAYTGAHLVRALLVRDGVVVAMTPRFQVNIWKSGWHFQP